MEPEAGLSPTMDPHDPASFQALSESPTLLSNSLMDELSQDGGLESNDEDANPQKSIFYGSNQKRRQSSAFPSSLTWDSDSEKETFDEEELQHFSNPHGLAAQSPGSPTCVQEQDGPDSRDYHTLKKSKNVLSDEDLTCPLDEEEQARDHTDEDPGLAQSEPQTLNEDDDGSVSDQDGLPLSNMKPKEEYQKTKIEGKGISAVPREKATRSGSEQDVYTFLGDSDSQSPPPGPWAHCTFVQRRRKKRALLRPFSGLNPWQKNPGAAARRSRVTPSRVKEYNQTVNDVGGVFEFNDEEDDQVQDQGEEFHPEIFTCVECSVYFNKQAHLREHMREHGQVDGAKAQPEEQGTARRRPRSLECMECGQNFADKLVLLKHHKLHEESRQRILEDMGKLNSFENTPETEKNDYRNSKQPAAKESFSNRSPFGGLKCSYRSDLAQELSDHSKPHVSPAKTAGHRASPRFQLKSNKKGTENDTSSTGVGERCPTRTSIDRSQHQVSDPQNDHKVDPLLGSSQSHCASTSPARPTEQPDLTGPPTEDAPLNRGSPGSALTDESIPKPGSPEPSDSTAVTPQRRFVAFKSTGTRRSKRSAVARGVMGRARTSALDSQTSDTSDGKSQIPETEETEGQRSSREATPEADSDSEGVVAVTVDTGVDSFTLDSEPNSPTLPKSNEERNEETRPQNDKDESSTFTTDMKYHHDDDDDDDDDDDGADEDVLNHLLNVLNEEEDEDDEDGGAFKTLEKRCPYCQDCFDNGIGLANHIRGHLNRVGVSYKVRHFISPEEVNAIEKKFSYQKKKKKATFSVMHCEFCSAGFDTRAGLSSHARAHLRDFGITNWEVTASPITVLRELFSTRPDLALSVPATFNAHGPDHDEDEEGGVSGKDDDAGTEAGQRVTESPVRVWKEERCDSEAEAPPDDLYQLDQSGPPADRPPPSPLSSPDTPSPGPGAGFEDERDIKPPPPLVILDSTIKAPRSPSSPSPSASQPGSPFGRSQSPSRSRSPSPVLRKAPISSLLPVSSLLRSQEHKNNARGHGGAQAAAHSRPLWAPQETDAPLNLTMDAEANEDIICKLCGAWFETRKGLSSHARAHLRHFGVEYSESRGSPIDLLNTLILTDDFKHRATSSVPDGPEDRRIHSYSVASPSPPTSSHLSPASKKPFSPSSLLFKNAHYRRSGSVTKNASSASSSASFHSMHSPPAKKLKQQSPQQVFRMSGVEMMSVPQAEPSKDVSCEFCGELFENRKGLSSHARSHLRQLGITVWSVNGSPIDTLRELITRRGLPCAVPPKPLKSPSSSPSLGSSRTSLPFSPTSSSIGNRTPLSQHQSAARKTPGSPPATSMASTALMVKTKPEPEQVEITLTEDGMGGCDGYGSESLHPSWIGTDNARPVSLVMAPEREPSRDIRCDFCGEFFENRKGLSSHARSHLRQMGITEWSVNGSPIDTLWEIMRNQGITPASSALNVKVEPQQDDHPSWNGHGYRPPEVSPKATLGLLHSGSRLHKHGLGPPNTPPSAKLFGMAQFGKQMLGNKRHLDEKLPAASQSKTFSPPPQDFSYKGKVSTDKYGVGRMEASCELCGFVFENRKALASHARAHLRQFGVTEWSVNGSPIETLSAWMRSRPETVAELHRSYLSGGHSVQKKKRSAAQWTSPLLTQAKTTERESTGAAPAPPQAPQDRNGNGTAVVRGVTAQDTEHSSSSAHGTLPRVQVARSELNVRVPRGIERRPLKHPSHADGGERESCPPKPSRTSTVPALVPKPPSTPLVKLVGKIYSLKCRFCDVEFQGPLSVQEDWIRHLQQHILKLDYNKPAPVTAPPLAKPDPVAPEIQASATTSTLTMTTTAPTPVSAKDPAPKLTPHPSVCTSSLSPIPTSAEAEQEVLAPAT